MNCMTAHRATAETTENLMAYWLEIDIEFMHKIGYYSCHSKSRSLAKALCEELPLFQSTEKKN